jgi:uncharacterized membrane protein YkoI
MRQWSLAAPVVALVLVAAVAADEEKIKLSDVPKKVMAAAKAKFPGAKFNHASKEKSDKGDVYELNITYKNHKIDVSLTADGKITSIEKEIAAKDLPEAVSKALEEKYPKATYKIVEEVTEGKKKFYEVVLVTADKKTFEVVIDPDGKITKTESKDKKKD